MSIIYPHLVLTFVCIHIDQVIILLNYVDGLLLDYSPSQCLEFYSTLTLAYTQPICPNSFILALIVLSEHYQ